MWLLRHGCNGGSNIVDALQTNADYTVDRRVLVDGGTQVVESRRAGRYVYMDGLGARVFVNHARSTPRAQSAGDDLGASKVPFLSPMSASEHRI